MGSSASSIRDLSSRRRNSSMPNPAGVWQWNRRGGRDSKSGGPSASGALNRSSSILMEHLPPRPPETPMPLELIADRPGHALLQSLRGAAPGARPSARPQPSSAPSSTAPSCAASAPTRPDATDRWDGRPAPAPAGARPKPRSFPPVPGQHVPRRGRRDRRRGGGPQGRRPASSSTCPCARPIPSEAGRLRLAPRRRLSPGADVLGPRPTSPSAPCATARCASATRVAVFGLGGDRPHGRPVRPLVRRPLGRRRRPHRAAAAGGPAPRRRSRDRPDRQRRRRRDQGADGGAPAPTSSWRPAAPTPPSRMPCAPAATPAPWSRPPTTTASRA